MTPLRELPSPSAKPARSILKKSLSHSSPRAAPPEPLFKTLKKDKRQIKHAQLISRITKSVQKHRRRRPNKKLVATLDSLADALPENEETSSRVAGSKPGEQINVIRRKSMKSRPGALKRREKLDKSERDRFAKNMAQMAVVQAPEDGQEGFGSSHNTTTSGRWAALRDFISQTLEQRPGTG